MPTNLELLEEADRRGILPPEKKRALDEARRRGLLGVPSPSETGLSLHEQIGLPTDPKITQRQAEAFSGLREMGTPPIGMSIDEYRRMTAQPRFTDKYIGRPAAEAAGATFAAGLAPEPFTATARGMAGAVAGGSIYDTIQMLEDYVKFPEERGRLLTPSRAGAEKAIAGATEAAKAEAAGQLGMRGAGAVVGGAFRGLGEITGLGQPAVKEGIKAARRLGIEYGAVETGQPFYRIAGKVSAVMPLIGGPLRKKADLKFRQLSNTYMNMLDDVAPRHRLQALSTNMSEAARSKLGSMERVAAHKYAQMHQMFNDMGDPQIIPMSTKVPKQPGMRDIAERELNELQKLPLTEEGRAGFRPFTQEFETALRSIATTGEYIRPSELEALRKTVNKALKQVGPEKANEARILEELLTAANNQLEFIRPDMLPEGADPRVLRSEILGAREAWADYKGMMETGAARRLARSNKPLIDFRATAGKRQPLNIDEMASDMLGDRSLLRSSVFVQDLENLVGKENRRALARAVLVKAGQADTVMTPAGHEVIVINPTKMKRDLGLTRAEARLGSGTGKANQEALDLLLEGTGVTSERLGHFLDVAEHVYDRSVVGDPATFLARRVILGGDVLPVAAGTAGEISGSLMSFGTFILAGRWFSKLISSKEGLNLLTDGLRRKQTRDAWATLVPRMARIVNERVSADFPDGTSITADPTGDRRGRP